MHSQMASGTVGLDLDLNLNVGSIEVIIAAVQLL